jgi:hypothetical protein
MAPVYFPGNGSNEVETADGNPILFDSGEPYTIALLILWTEDPGNEGIFRSGSANTGNWLWMLSGGRLWGRQANVNSSASGSGPLITAGWHTLARVWDGREVRQYVDGVRTNTTTVTATGSWPLYRFGYQFTGSEALCNETSANPVRTTRPAAPIAAPAEPGRGWLHSR